MNEQQQAEILARWLEDPTGDLPEGLDADVVESIIALKPELAPPPTLSVEDILSGVTQGPFANPMPIGASVGAAPELSPESGSSSRGRPWWIAIAGVGGLSSIAAAALVAIGLGVGGVFLTTDQAPRSESASRVAAPAAAAPHDAVAQADTGAAAGEQARRQGTVAVAKSKPARRPLADPIPDAVAFAEDLEDFDDAVDGDIDAKADGYGFRSDVDRAAQIPEIGGSEGSARGGAPAAPPLASAPTALPPPPPAEPPPSARPRPARPMVPAGAAAEPEAEDAEYAPADAVREEESLARDSSDEAIAAAPTTTESLKTSRRSLSIGGERKRLKKERSAKEKRDQRAAAGAPMNEPADHGMAESDKDDASPAEVPIPIPGAPDPIQGAPVSTGSGGPGLPAVVDSLAPGGATAKYGAMDAIDEAITAAQAALQARDPAAAIAACDQGLATHTGATRVRQMLLALKGDAFLGQGNQAAAEQLWQQAREIRNALASP